MNIVKRIYREMNIYYDNNLPKTLLQMCSPILLITGIITLVSIMSYIFNFDLNKETMKFCIGIIIFTSCFVFLGLILIWYFEVRPILNKVRKNLKIQKKWDILLNEFNKSH